MEKEPKDKRINFMSDDSTYKKLCSVADAQGRTLASTLRRLIDVEFRRLNEYGG